MKPIQCCRVCMTTDPRVKLLSMHIQRNGEKAVDLLNYIFGCYINRSDQLPQMICEKCHIKLKPAYKLKKDFSKSEKVLRRKLAQDRDVIQFEDGSSGKSLDYEEYFAGSIVSDIKEEADQIQDVQYYQSQNMKGQIQGSGIEFRGENSGSSITDRRIERINGFDVCVEKNLLFLDLLPNLIIEKLNQHQLKSKILDISRNSRTNQESSREMQTPKQIRNFRYHYDSGYGDNNECLFVCLECSFRTTTKDSMKNHFKTVHVFLNKKKYCCDECPKKFNFERALEKHQKNIHTGEQFRCDSCVKRYNSKKKLKYHIRASHRIIPNRTPSQLFHCPECDSIFKLKKSMKFHMKIHKKYYAVQCQHCDERFASNAHLMQHVLIQHFTEKIKCVYCTCQFTQKSGYKKHFMCMHKDLDPKIIRCFLKRIDKIIIDYKLLKFRNFPQKI